MKENYTKWLPVRLTKDELLDRGRLMSERIKEREEQEKLKAEATREFARVIKNLTGEIAQLSTCISSGEEPRPVECSEYPDLKRKERIVTRLDTGEVIQTKPLSQDDLQLRLKEREADE